MNFWYQINDSLTSTYMGRRFNILRYFPISKKSIIDINNSNSWYKKKILDIKKLIFWYQRIIFWYQEFGIFISKNQFLILKKNFEFISCISKLILLIAINNLFSWYQEFWFFDIIKYILWYQEISLNSFLISENRFYDIRKSIFSYLEFEWYQKMSCIFYIKNVNFWHQKSYFDIWKSYIFMKSEIGCLISENRFLDIRKTVIIKYHQKFEFLI